VRRRPLATTQPRSHMEQEKIKLLYAGVRLHSRRRCVLLDLSSNARKGEVKNRRNHRDDAFDHVVLDR